MYDVHRFLNAVFIYVLGLVILSAFSYQFIQGETPCSLCNLQRLAMIGIAVGLLMNLRMGIKIEHYGLSLLSALFGLFVALKQIGLHVCPQFPSYGEPVLGFSIFVWSFFVFLSSIFSLSVLIILFGFLKHKESPLIWNGWDKLAFSLIFLITAANAITSFINCRFGYCKGI